MDAQENKQPLDTQSNKKMITEEAEEGQNSQSK